jgi:hypothetical protein
VVEFLLPKQAVAGSNPVSRSEGRAYPVPTRADAAVRMLRDFASGEGLSDRRERPRGTRGGGGGAAIYHRERIRQDMHVCTADYVQTVGRVHCGVRRAGADVLERQATTFIGYIPVALWVGDFFSRLSTGQHSWQQSNDPWHPAEDGTGGQWTEAPWDGAPLFQTLRNAHNVDLGACSVFVPWKWDDRAPRLDAMIGPMLGDRGLAELTLDELDAARADSAHLERARIDLTVRKRGITR